MDHFTAKFSDSERDAITDAMLGVGCDRMTPGDAVAAAREGKLPGIGRFDMSESYARKLRARALAPSPDDWERLIDPAYRGAVIEHMYAKLADAVLKEGERLLREAGRDKLDATQARHVMRALKEYLPNRNRRPNPAPGELDHPPHTSDTEQHQDAATIIEQLRQSAKANGHTPNARHTPTAPNGNGTAT